MGEVVLYDSHEGSVTGYTISLLAAEVLYNRYADRFGFKLVGWLWMLLVSCCSVLSGWL